MIEVGFDPSSVPSRRKRGTPLKYPWPDMKVHGNYFDLIPGGDETTRTVEKRMSSHLAHKNRERTDGLVYSTERRNGVLRIWLINPKVI